jgi:hypothetical protein
VTNTAAAHQPGHLEELPGSRGHPAGPGHSASQVNSASRDAVAEFERLYRGNVDAVTAFFARRTADPQVVADLAADTFVAVITSIATFDPRKGTAHRGRQHRPRHPDGGPADHSPRARLRHPARRTACPGQRAGQRPRVRRQGGADDGPRQRPRDPHGSRLTAVPAR